MSEFASSRLIAEFLFGFGALFAIINPYGLALVFFEKTMNLSERERKRIALQVAIYAFGVLLISLFVGSQILNFFGVSIPALRIAGGLVVATSGWSMLNASSTLDVHETSTANLEAVRKLTFFPLTMPLTTGPGTIATAIAIGANRPQDLNDLLATTAAWLVVALAVTATIYHAYTRSSAMARLFGQEGTRVLTRLSAFLLLCIGVQIIVTGVVDVMRPILENVPRS
jgi:multiple antibiotic resistance protein